MTTASSISLTTPAITRAAATELLDAARAACADLGVDMAIAVTDPQGRLKAFQSMDGTSFRAHDVAINKAWTAVSFRQAAGQGGGQLHRVDQPAGVAAVAGVGVAPVQGEHQVGKRLPAEISGATSGPKTVNGAARVVPV